MSKRARNQPGYATLLNDVRHRGFNSKYRLLWAFTKLNVLYLDGMKHNCGSDDTVC